MARARENSDTCQKCGWKPEPPIIDRPYMCPHCSTPEEIADLERALNVAESKFRSRYNGYRYN